MFGFAFRASFGDRDFTTKKKTELESKDMEPIHLRSRLGTKQLAISALYGEAMRPMSRLLALYGGC